MTKLQEALALIEQLTISDRQALFARLSALAFPPETSATGIVATPEVCGGRPRIVNTRIPVSGIVEAKRLGMTDEQILDMYPTISLTDIENALVYYAKHRAEIEAELVEEEEEGIA